MAVATIGGAVLGAVFCFRNRRRRRGGSGLLDAAWRLGATHLCRRGVEDRAIEAVKLTLARGFSGQRPFNATQFLRRHYGSDELLTEGIMHHMVLRA
jgi:hypothetical protein